MINRITIDEKDTTVSESTVSSTDVVYIPGFAVGGSVNSRVPTLCRTLSEFRLFFGETAPKFITDQAFPDEFRDDAIDSDQDPIEGTEGTNSKKYIMFAMGTSDPSYIYAYELLAAGLPIVYERINDISDITIDNVDEETLTQIRKKGYSIFNGNNVYDVDSFVLHKNDTNGTDDTYSIYRCKSKYSPASEDPSDNPADYADNFQSVSNNVIIPDVSVEKMYTTMTLDYDKNKDIYGIYSTHEFASLSQVSDYDIKYITSGGYPTFEYFYSDDNTDNSTQHLCNKLIALAAHRKDAIAFIDHTNNKSRALTGVNSVYNKVNNDDTAINSPYATMITPYAVYSGTTGSIVMPGSFGYLLALAKSLKTYPSWLPIAGVTRGSISQIKSLCTEKTLTNAIADSYQTDPTSQAYVGSEASINAITNIRGQGYTIWGDRTLGLYQKGSVGYAALFLHMRNMICDIRKQCYVSAQRYLFEQNTDILWINFTNSIKNLLDQMVASSVIAYYKFTKLQPSDKTKISARITIKPVYAVESFDIEIVMTDDEITVLD